MPHEIVLYKFTVVIDTDTNELNSEYHTGQSMIETVGQNMLETIVMVKRLRWLVTCGGWKTPKAKREIALQGIPDEKRNRV